MRPVGICFRRKKKWMQYKMYSASAMHNGWVTNNILLQRNRKQRSRRLRRNRRSIWQKSQRHDPPSLLYIRKRNLAPNEPESKTITRRCPLAVPL